MSCERAKITSLKSREMFPVYLRMQVRVNNRRRVEFFFNGRHLKLMELRNDYEGPLNKYLSRTNIPAYPHPVFRATRLKHDTNQAGLKGIREKGGFMNPHDDGSLLWFSLDVGPLEIKSAERRLLETTFPDRTEEQIQSQQSFLEQFASSPAFLRKSRLGSYRFTFSVEEVLEAYKDQFCPGAEPVMRVMKTVLYKQEVAYVVLVHSPANQEHFSEYPLLVHNSDPDCTFKDGCFVWKCEAMCKTHRYRLVQNKAEKKMDAVEVEGRKVYYVWDHVVVALHVGKQVLKFDVNQLREKLTFCEKGDVKLASFQDYPKARSVVKELWPAYPLPLKKDGETTQKGPREDQHPEEAEDKITKSFTKLKL